MALPKIYSFVVRHNFGANAVVTADLFGSKYNSSGELGYDASATSIFLSQLVADATDVESTPDINNDTNKHVGINGTFQVQSQSGNVTGSCELYLRTKTGQNSDSIRSRLMASISFDAEAGPLTASFRAS